MAKPPKAPPSSDIDGVHEDKEALPRSTKKNSDPGKELELARRQSIGKPERGAAKQ